MGLGSFRPGLKPPCRPLGEDEVRVRAAIGDVTCHLRPHGVGVAGIAAQPAERIIHRYLAVLGEYSVYLLDDGPIAQGTFELFDDRCVRASPLRRR